MEHFVLQEWLVTEDGKVKHGEMCLGLSDSAEGSVIHLQRCTPRNSQQAGFFTAVSSSC